MGPASLPTKDRKLVAENHDLEFLEVLGSGAKYDLRVAELWSNKEPSPGFLVHDSTIFDGVDERESIRQRWPVSV